jgi:hypothetical protein
MEFEIQKTETPIELFKALEQFQSECPIIPKGKKGFGYNYAELSKTIEIIRPILHKNNIGFTQLIYGTGNLKTIIFHTESGQSLENDLILPTGIEMKGMNLFQTDGAKFTYYKRYCLLSMLSVFSEDEDIDAKGQVKQPEAQKPAQPPVKRKLNEHQFISILGAINAGQYTKEEVLSTFDLSPEQKVTIESINQ